MLEDVEEKKPGHADSCAELSRKWVKKTMHSLLPSRNQSLTHDWEVKQHPTKDQLLQGAETIEQEAQPTLPLEICKNLQVPNTSFF